MYNYYIMKLKDLNNIQVMNLQLYDLDIQQFVEYHKKYEEYNVVQLFADIINQQLSVCIDVTSDKNYN